MSDMTSWRKWKRTKQLQFREEVVPMGDNTSRLQRILQQKWRRKTRYTQSMYGEYGIEEVWLDVGDEPSNGE